MKKTAKIVAITVLVCCVLFWVGTIVRCEILTAEHIDEFSAFDELKDVSKRRILTYTSDYARIYVVDPGRYAGHIYSFTRQTVLSDWELFRWHTVWSSVGSADGFIWPYIR